MIMGSGKESPKEGVVSLGVCGMGGVEVFQLVAGFKNGQSLFDPVNSGVCSTEPGESKDDVFSPTIHDVEEMFLSDPFNVHVECAGVVDHTSFVCSLVDIANGNRRGEFFNGKAVFSDELPVDTRDIGTRVYQCRGVNDFEGVQRGDQLNRDVHRFV